MLPPPVVLFDINSQEVWDTAKAAFPKANIYLSDSFYKTTTKEELMRFLKDDVTNEYRYISEYHDCDSFSFQLMGSIHCIEWGALPFGIMWTSTPNGGHAVNCFIDDKKEVWIVEPQNDQIYKLPTDWVPYLVII
jgi:hypothetical protein